MISEAEILRKQVKKTIRELCLYLLFLVTSCVVAFGNVGDSLYFCTDMLNKLFVDKHFRSIYDTDINFKDLSNSHELWQFIDTVLLDGLYGEDLIGAEGSMFMKENRVLGGVRMRQLRVRNDSCVIHKDFEHLFKNECYGFYSKSSEDKNSFGLRVGSAWKYHTSDELEGFVTWGVFQMYHGGGFYHDFDESREITRSRLMTLRDNGWINRGTRVVFIEFTIFNPNINVFCSAKLTAEVLPTGGLVTSTNFRVMRERRISILSDYVWTLFAIAFFLQIAIYSYNEVGQMIKLGRKYFESFWNWIDVTILVIAYAATGFIIFRTIYIEEKLKKLNENTKQFLSFDEISFWHAMFLDALGVFIFLIWIRMLKFIKFNQTMLQFVRTLANCTKDVAGFGFMFLIVFVAYAQLGNVLFGSEIHDFRTFTDSLFTLMRTILGDFDYLSIERANRVLGPIFFLSYIFFVFFVLLNMFLAIINDTYAEVKANNTQKVLPVGQFIKDKVKTFYKKSVRRSYWDSKESRETQVDPDEIESDQEASTSGHPNHCSDCKINQQKFNSFEERIFALENAVDHCALKFGEIIKKLK